MNAENEPDRPTEAANADEGLVPKIGPLFKGIEQPLVPKIGPIIETAPMMRQLEAFARGSEALRRQMEPFIRGNEALQRQVAPIAEAAAQLARIGPWPKIGGSLALPLSLRLAAAVDADMRDLLPAHEPVVHQMTLATTLTGTADLAGVGTITATGSVTSPPMGASGQMTVKDRPKGLAALSDGEIVFLVLVWLYAFVLPWFGRRCRPRSTRC